MLISFVVIIPNSTIQQLLDVYKKLLSTYSRRQTLYRSKYNEKIKLLQVEGGTCPSQCPIAGDANKEMQFQTAVCIPQLEITARIATSTQRRTLSQRKSFKVTLSEDISRPASKQQIVVNQSATITNTYTNVILDLAFHRDNLILQLSVC